MAAAAPGIVLVNPRGVRELLLMALKKSGFRVITVDANVDALGSLPTEVDLVLLDAAELVSGAPAALAKHGLPMGGRPGVLLTGEDATPELAAEWGAIGIIQHVFASADAMEQIRRALYELADAR